MIQEFYQTRFADFGICRKKHPQGAAFPPFPIRVRVLIVLLVIGEDFRLAGYVPWIGGMFNFFTFCLREIFSRRKRDISITTTLSVTTTLFFYTLIYSPIWHLLGICLAFA